MRPASSSGDDSTRERILRDQRVVPVAALTATTQPALMPLPRASSTEYTVPCAHAGDAAARLPSLRFHRTRPLTRDTEYSAPLFFITYTERPHSTGGNSMSTRPVTAHSCTKGGRSATSSGSQRVRSFV